MSLRHAAVCLLAAIAAAQTAPAPPRPAPSAPERTTKPKSKSRPAKPVVLTPEQRAAHALARLTFGARPGEVQQVMQRGLDSWFEQQLNPEAIDDKALDARLGPLRTLRMAPRELVTKFPPQPLVRAVAEGHQPMPDDPAVKMVYVAQIERYKEQTQAQKIQQEMQKNSDAQMKSAMANAVSTEQQPEAENGMAAALLAERLLALPKEKRMPALEQMSPADLRLLGTALRAGGVRAGRARGAAGARHSQRRGDRRADAGQAAARHLQPAPVAGGDDRFLVQPLQRFPFQRCRPVPAHQL